MSGPLTAILVAIVAIVLIYASVEDMNTRTVRNVHWAVIGGLGTAVNLFVFAKDGVLFGLAVAAMSATILYGILNESECDGYERIVIPAAVTVLAALSCVLAPSANAAYSALSIPVFTGIFILMYYTGLLRGGADAKCMVSLTVAFPAYPVLYSLPLIKITDNLYPIIFPFPLAVLFHALLITLSLSVPMFLINLGRGNTGKHMFTGYVTDIGTARNSHVWPMYDIRDGELTRISPADDSGDVYDRLEMHGEKEIWVTPMIPFIIPITVSYVLTAIFGNPVFLIL